MPYSLTLSPDVYARGDSRPPLEATITDSNGERLDLSDARRADLVIIGSEPVLERRGDINAEDNVLRVDWNRNDLDIPARPYRVKARVGFTDRSQLTAPTDGRTILRITE